MKCQISIFAETQLNYQAAIDLCWHFKKSLTEMAELNVTLFKIIWILSIWILHFILCLIQSEGLPYPSQNIKKKSHSTNENRLYNQILSQGTKVQILQCTIYQPTACTKDSLVKQIVCKSADYWSYSSQNISGINNQFSNEPFVVLKGTITIKK